MRISYAACRALDDAELHFRMEELEALEAAFGDIEAGAAPPGPALPLPPPPGRYTSWHGSQPLSENIPRPRYAPLTGSVCWPSTVVCFLRLPL